MNTSITCKVSYNLLPRLSILNIKCIAAKLKPNSLWAYYAMLKSTIQRQNNIDITYPEVTSFIKKCALGFRPQTNVFQPKELQRFFAESNDYEYLAVKVRDSEWTPK